MIGLPIHFEKWIWIWFDNHIFAMDCDCIDNAKKSDWATACSNACWKSHLDLQDFQTFSSLSKLIKNYFVGELLCKFSLLKLDFILGLIEVIIINLRTKILLGFHHHQSPNWWHNFVLWRFYTRASSSCAWFSP